MYSIQHPIAVLFHTGDSSPSSCYRKKTVFPFCCILNVSATENPRQRRTLVTQSLTKKENASLIAYLLPMVGGCGCWASRVVRRRVEVGGVGGRMDGS